MDTAIALGLSGVLLGGLLNGSFVVPMKRIRGWQWENTWLIYSLTGLLIFPLALALATIPQVTALITEAPPGILVKVLLFGFGWGIGSVLFGLGVTRLGLALGYGVILGVVATAGSLLPLVLLHPERVATRQGFIIFAGTALVVIGISFCALAGRSRDRGASRLPRNSNGTSFLSGLLICILAGFFAAMLNLAFTFGTPLQQQAVTAGARPTAAANVLWALALGAGFLPNAGYSLYLMRKNRSWQRYFQEPGEVTRWLGAGLMGIVFFASFIVYGIGADELGSLGGVIGWPVLMSMSLITANAWGWLMGEWKMANSSARRHLMIGVVVLVLAIVVISAGNG